MFANIKEDLSVLRHTIKILICFLLLVTPFYSLASVVESEGTTATINTAVINVREGPGLSFNVIQQVKLGEKYSIIEKKSDWVRIKLSNSKSGWVAAWLIKESGTASPSTTSLIVSTVDSLRIRTGPGPSFQVSGYMNKGQEATFIEKNENWTKIQYKNTQGWVSSQYVTAKSTATQPPSNSNTGTAKTGKVTVNNLNIRSQPSLQANIVGKLSIGDTVTITNQRENWLEIQYKNSKAWVTLDYINISKQEDGGTNPTPVPSPTASTGIVTASSLNVRDRHSLSGSVIASLKQGETVTIISESNQWFEITFSNNKKGWVASWYIERTTNQPPSSAPISDKTVKILHNGTNIRSGAATTTSVVTRANEGDTFKIIATEGDWFKIQLPGNKTGFIAGWIVQVSGDTPTVVKPGVNQYLKNKTVIIDPGHGGRDSGAVGSRGTLEKDLTLRTSKLVYDKLHAAGANVIMTRSSDTYVSLASRVSISHYRNADAFISVHYDSINDSSVRGITSYYYKNIDLPVASSLQTELIKYTGFKDRGHRSGNFQVLRSNRQPSALLELGYLSNPTEELALNSSSFQENVSNGIFYGLAQYFKSR